MDRRGYGLLRELKGGDSHRDFARRIGVSKSTVTMLLSGERQAGRRVIERLLAVFPAERERIVDVFLSPNGHEYDEPVTEATR